MDDPTLTGPAGTTSPAGAAAPAPRPAPPRPRPPAAQPQPKVGQAKVEEIEDIEEIEEVGGSAASGSEGDEGSASERSGGWFSNFDRQEFMRGSACTVSSCLVHMTILIVLALVLGKIAEPPKPPRVAVDVAEWTQKESLLKIELDPVLAMVTERPEAMQSSSSIISAAAATVSNGGGGSGGGGGGSFGEGPGPAGTGSGVGGGSGFDTSLFNSIGRGRGHGTGDGIGDIFLDMPSSRQLIAATPDGQIGDGRAIVGSYQEAMDRLTQEILWMMDKSKVLVVWVFDQSESMKDDQKEIRDRIEHVYTQLGIVSRHNEDALETAVVSFGKGYMQHTQKPTYDRSEIRAAIEEVPNDPSGEEMTCSAVLQAIATHRQYAQKTRRQMALILVTDESGNRQDNDSQLERAIAEAKSARCKIYVLGREAVFGYPYAYMRWVHPQTLYVHWLQIDRGPETAFVEQLQTDGFHRRYDAHPSGFGYYECTRMGRETGGIFFMLPSLEVNLVHGQKRNYDMEAPYYPDLRSKLEVKVDIDKSQLRTMLEAVIYDLNPYNPEAQKIIEMRVEFPRDYPQFVPAARQEQAKAIIYLEYLARAEKTVSKMEAARKQEASPRWQANYDLLYAQLVAYQARMYEYGAALEDFIKNPRVAPLNRPPNLTHVEWDLRTCHTIRTGETVKPYIERATAMFKDVIANHPSTPWAARAEYELQRGFGCELIPDYDGPHPVPSGTLIPVPKL